MLFDYWKSLSSHPALCLGAWKGPTGELSLVLEEGSFYLLALVGTTPTINTVTALRGNISSLKNMAEAIAQLAGMEPFVWN
jgi:hypothetical protein